MTKNELAERLSIGERHFRGQKFEGIELPGFNLSGADFSYCSFVGLNLSGTNFRNTRLDGATRPTGDPGH